MKARGEGMEKGRLIETIFKPPVAPRAGGIQLVYTGKGAPSPLTDVSIEALTTLMMMGKHELPFSWCGRSFIGDLVYMDFSGGNLVF